MSAVAESSGRSAMGNTPKAAIKSILSNEFGWIWIATAFLFAISAWLAPGTVKLSSIMAMLPFAAILAITAVGQTVVIQQRGLDMSLPGIMSLGGLLFTYLGFVTDSQIVATVLTLAAAIAMGTLNGYLVARVNITPIVVTLATNAILLGAGRSLSSGSPMTAPQVLADFSHVRLAGIPMTLFLALGFILFVSVMTRSTLHGRRFVAVGANPATARAAGIPVLRYQIGTYAIAAVCFCVAGMLYAGYIGSASYIAGNDYLLPAIAAVVVGGTPFSGGRGSVVASGVAALFLAQLGQLVLSMGASTALQLFVQAAAIIIAVTIRRIPDYLGL
jgi:ribose transport system permease protein